MAQSLMNTLMCICSLPQCILSPIYHDKPHFILVNPPPTVEDGTKSFKIEILDLCFNNYFCQFFKIQENIFFNGLKYVYISSVYQWLLCLNFLSCEKYQTQKKSSFIFTTLFLTTVSQQAKPVFGCTHNTMNSNLTRI